MPCPYRRRLAGMTGATGGGDTVGTHGRNRPTARRGRRRWASCPSGPAASSRDRR